MYNQHSKFINKQILYSLIVLVINGLLFCFSFDWPSFLSAIPLLSNLYYLILLFKERKLFDTYKPKFRIVIFIVYYFILVLGVLGVYEIEEYTYLSICSVLGVSIAYLCLLMSLLASGYVKRKELKSLSRNQQIDELDPIDGREIKTIRKSKTFGIGYVSRLDSGLTLVLLIGLIIIGAVVMSIMGQDNLLLSIVLFFLYVFSIWVLVLLIRSKIIGKPLREFENNYDYAKLEEYCNKVINNPNVHIETANYYKIILANYVGIFSIDKREEILKDIFEPSFPLYRFFYYLLVDSFKYLDDKEKLLETYEKIKKDALLQSKNLQRQIDSQIYQAKVIFGEIEVEDVYKAIPLVGKTKLAIINQKTSLLRYYYYRNDKENVNKMFNEIKEITKDIPLYPKEDIRLNKYKL